MNMGQDRQMQMVRSNGRNQFRQYAGQNVGNQNRYSAVQNFRNLNPNRNGNVVVIRAEDSVVDCSKEEAGIQLQAKEFDLMATAADLDEIEEVNANYILMANLQQASASEEHYTELLESIPEPHQVQQNDSNVSFEDSEAAKFVRYFKSLAKEADESLAKYKALELEIEHLLRAVGLPKIDESHALSKPVTLNSVPTPQEPKIVKNEKVIALGMFRINPFKTSREEKFVPNKPINASVRINLIIVSQPHVITKEDANSDLNGLYFIGVNITTKTRRPQPRSNTKNDRVPSVSKSSCIKNKEVEVEEHHRNLLLFRKKKHMSSECNNIKLAIQNAKTKVVCDMCKQCLIIANHDVCVLNYVNSMNSHGKTQKANVSYTENQKKQKPMVKKPRKVDSRGRLASPTPSEPSICRRWSPTRRIFYCNGKIIKSRASKCQSDNCPGNNACTSNPLEPYIKRFPNPASFLGKLSKFVYGASTRVIPSI
ncbi:hypothetical protein Tco_1474626 [Tanacetum coccineum]